MKGIPRQFYIFFAIFLCSITFLVYSHTLSAPFIYDDFVFIVNNPALRQPITVDSIVGSTYGQPTRVVGFLTFILNYHLHYLQLPGYHLTSIAIHILTVLFLWMLMRLILSSLKEINQSLYSEWVAFFTALFFAVHPVETQAVTYLSQRIASLATLFYLMSLYVYACARLGDHRFLIRILYFLLSIGLGVLGMFTKEIVITLPLSIVMFELFFVRRNEINKVSDRVFYWKGAIFLFIFVLAIAFMLKVFSWERIQSIWFHQTVSQSHPGDVYNLWTYFITQLRVVFKLFSLFVLPVNQNFDYDFSMSHSFLEWPVIGSAIILFSLFAAAFFVKRQRPLIAYGIFWFFLTISVEFIPRPHVIFEHKLYLTSIGLCMALSAGLYHVTKDVRRYLIVCSFLAGSLSILTFQRNSVYTSRVSLWEDVVKKSPQRERVYINLGEAYFEQEDYEAALRTYTKVLSFSPNSHEAYGNRGLTLQQMDRDQLALEDFNKAIELNSEYRQAYINRGNLHRKFARWEEGLADYNQALKLYGGDINALNNRGTLYLMREEFASAQADFESALRIDPHFAEAYINLGTVYLNQKLYDKAIENYSKALKLQPNQASAIFNRSSAYEQAGKDSLALADLNQVLRYNPNFFKALFTRAEIYIKQKDFEKALKDLNKALYLAPDVEAGYLQRAKVYFHLKQFDLGIKDCTTLMTRDPGNSMAYYFRSVISYEMGDFTRAYQDLLMAEALGYPVPPYYKEDLKQKTAPIDP